MNELTDYQLFTLVIFFIGLAIWFIRSIHIKNSSKNVDKNLPWYQDPDQIAAHNEKIRKQYEKNHDISRWKLQKNKKPYITSKEEFQNRKYHDYIESCWEEINK